ncbi:MAG: 4Fe-4S binding protein [Candidatus Omnitrophica bacterium]|nr:4Fe-4S binding protein [Candidatus Omnitrophota bacterium]MDD5236522.1 4Fe-4S binding protein [Candidatus Omnitrophota bacterium]MDD5610242.1 4Fe-4S binding protein [Candidatus Omnitrophota bacterium]
MKSKTTSLIISGFIFSILVIPAFFLKQSISLLFATVLWDAVVGVLAYFMLARGQISKFRAILFVLLAWAFLFLFKFKPLQFQDSSYCHIAISSILLNFVHNQYLAITGGRWGIFGVLSLGFLWLVLTFILGQAWCSWVCFYGGFDEGFSRVLKKPFLKFRLPAKLRDFSIAFALFIIIISFTTAIPIFCVWVCPLKATTGFFDSDMLVRHVQLTLFILITAFSLVILPLVIKKRTFCSFLCPFGAFISVFGQINPFRISIDTQKCTQCKACIEKCPVFAINETNLTRGLISNYCNRCGACMDICPAEAIRITFFGKEISLPQNFPLVLREIFEVRTIFIVICLLISGAVSNSFMPQALIKLVKMIMGGL